MRMRYGKKKKAQTHYTNCDQKEKASYSMQDFSRTIAQALWEEADKDIARARQMLEEANDAETLPQQRS